jgi:hypothetical protein
VSVSELNLLDDVTVGCSAGSIRLEQFEAGAGASTAAPGIPGSFNRALCTVGAKYLTPFALRDPVAIQFVAGALHVRRGDGDRKVLCSCSFDRVTKIMPTVTGVSVIGEGGFSFSVSLHDDHKKQLLLKLLHAKTRGAPPPKEVRPLTKPIVPKPRSTSASSNRSLSVGRDAVKASDQVTRKSVREPLSAALARIHGASPTPGAAPSPTSTHNSSRLSGSQQAELDRERRRAQLYKQLSQYAARTGV